MKHNLHNAILSRLQEERQVVTLITINGYQMKGRITGFDDLVVVVEVRKEQQIVYRHAISTITPDRAIDLDGLRGEELQ
ncbi:RNA chaperone Hfq [Lawsonibacter sp. JLR.KK007]|jgi:host factor-I protein|uniref:RNA chaperone Hfq n=1 Tax=Lawsonibacter sp. JLR.KK007 TaxID=3114293 RepID=UPI002FF3988E